jgi:hypothetical protein
MGGKRQVEVEVVVEASLERAWEYLMDISKIPEFHPRVDHVELLSGSPRRAQGVSYQCEIQHGRGRGRCVEQVTELVPLKSFRTTIPEDTWGLSDLFDDYFVDTCVTPVGQSATRISIRQFYAANSLKAKLVNRIARPRARSQTRATLLAIKRAIETQASLDEAPGPVDQGHAAGPTS